MPKILIVDDEPEVRSVLGELLTERGLQIVTAEDGEAGLECARRDAPSVILLDLDMPKRGGMEVLAKLREEDCRVPVIILTVHDDVPKVVEAMRLGAYDYLTKPFRNDDLMLRVEHALERQSLLEEVETLRSEAGATSLKEQMGGSQEIQKLTQQVRVVAASNFSVVIQGETGTGKELVARAIHQQSARRTGRFVALDCGAMPEALIESELFGHEKGAFTGADRRKEGYFQLAEGGTLFLDEIPNLPLSVQAKLLRVLQEREVHALGSRRAVHVDVRVIVAANLPLEGEVRAGRFRQDLYYRLAEFLITLPPLRDRREDILYLVRRFLDDVSMELRRPIRDISEAAIQLLLGYSWPGNARELKNVIRRAALMSSGTITAEQLNALAADAFPTEPTAAPSPPRAGRSLREVAEAAAAEAEREVIRQALEATRGNKSEAARLLKTDYKTLYLKLKRYGISAADSG